MASRGFIRTFYGEHPEKADENFRNQFRKYIFDYYSTFISKKEGINGIIEDNINKHILGDRLNKIKSNIQKSLEEKIQFPFVCYTFGTDNHKYLLSLGIHSILVHDFPNPFYMYWHKLEALKFGMSDFDEIVFVDWDTYLIKEIDEQFWTLLNEKDVIQASLNRYRHPHLSHRIGKQNQWCPSGAFMYCRDKSVPDKIIEYWKKEAHIYSCEVGIARLTDEWMGKWDINEYHRRFEPHVFTSRYSKLIKDLAKNYIYCRGGGKLY